MIAVNCFETDEEMPIIERSLSYERLSPHGIRALREKSHDEGLIPLVKDDAGRMLLNNGYMWREEGPLVRGKARAVKREKTG